MPFLSAQELLAEIEATAAARETAAIEAYLRREFTAVSALSSAAPAEFPADVFSYEAFRWVRQDWVPSRALMQAWRAIALTQLPLPTGARIVRLEIISAPEQAAGCRKQRWTCFKRWGRGAGGAGDR